MKILFPITCAEPGWLRHPNSTPYPSTAQSGAGSEPAISPNYANDSFRKPNVRTLDQTSENAKSSRFSKFLLSVLVSISTRCIAASPLRAGSGRYIPQFSNKLLDRCIPCSQHGIQVYSGGSDGRTSNRNAVPAVVWVDMIRPSPELLAVSRRLHQAILAGKTDILASFFSLAEEMRFIGTAENEYWNGSVVSDGIADFFSEVPDIYAAEEIEAEAYENGETGWSSFVHRIHFAGLPEFSIQRTTLVFVLDGAGWKIIQRHGSAPIPNTVHMGTEQTAIQRLVDAAREEGLAFDQTEGLASVLFTDLEGSTELATALGDQRWSVLINEHFGSMEEIVTAHHGQFVKSLGDGTLSSFPSAQQALRAAIKMQKAILSAKTEPRLGLRVGIHTGDVVQTRGDFFGAVVNKAARITSAASAGKIMVSDATRAMVGSTSNFKFKETISASFKGFEGQHLIHRLEWD